MTIIFHHDILMILLANTASLEPPACQPVGSYLSPIHSLLHGQGQMASPFVCKLLIKLSSPSLPPSLPPRPSVPPPSGCLCPELMPPLSP